MTIKEASRIGKRGTLVIPAKLRQLFGLEEGAEVIAEQTPEGVLIRPAMTVPIEIYTPERKAELLLETAVDPADYEAAREEVRALGLDPDAIPHSPPGND